MPGFDVDSKEVETEKLKKAPERVDEIVEAIRQKKNPSLYCAGSCPSFEELYGLSVIYSLCDRQQPILCYGYLYLLRYLCEVCPTGTISLSGDGKPEWADTCVQCVACIHRCPVRAIEYGTISLKKGRYHHPEFK